MSPEVARAYPALEAWWSEGERISLQASNQAPSHTLFVHEQGTGPWLTLLHGFPTSSWDWAPLLNHLGKGYRTLAPDLLGFGASDKPRGYDYSLDEQADLVTALWRKRGVDRTWLVAHDYSVSLTQELLARQLEGADLGADIQGITLLNGGLFYSRIQRRLIQDALRVPVLGALLVRLMPRWRFEASFSDLFSPDHQPTKAELAQHWRALKHGGGRASFHRVARYLGDREANEQRWTRALIETDVPIRYVWGPEDPISGRNILEGVRELVADPDIVELDGIGHYPQLEVPERVASHLLVS